MIVDKLIIIELTIGSTWIVPKDWNNFFHGPLGFANRIECVGGGAGGAGGIDGIQAGYGGGSGAYARYSGLVFDPKTEVKYNVGLGGSGGKSDPDQPHNNGFHGEDTWFYSSDIINAKGGTCPLAGQAWECAGEIKYSGTNGKLGPISQVGYDGGPGFLNHGSGGNGGKHLFDGSPGQNGIIRISYYPLERYEE